jgi:hypothetical protein
LPKKMKIVVELAVQARCDSFNSIQFFGDAGGIHASL